jgi:hypothetical protein
MALRVCWRLMYRVANQAAFDKCLARTIPVLNDGSVVSECKPYLKMPELWECAVDTPIHIESVPDQVFACLRMAYDLATGWYVIGALSPESAHGFEGVFAAEHAGGARSNVPGLEWASFVLLEARRL